VQGLKGTFCSPTCKQGQCPTDVPAGVTATPACVLRSPTGSSNCALECEASADCGSAKCRHVQGIGLCTYADDANLQNAVEAVVVSSQHLELVV